MKRTLIVLSGIAIAAFILFIGLSAVGSTAFTNGDRGQTVFAEDKGPTSPTP